VPPCSWIAVLRAADGCRLRAPVTPAGVDAAEGELAVTFPGELRALYLASDGVLDEPGQWFVIWPLADLVSRNQAAWAAGGSTRRRLLAFGDDGTGSPFCVSRSEGPDVFFWNPVINEVTHLAPSLTSFWNRWIKGLLPPH
jgi:cell wall assembly regulator SMI1